MKKFLLILSGMFFIASISVSYAVDEVYLDMSENSPQEINIKPLKYDSGKKEVEKRDYRTQSPYLNDSDFDKLYSKKSTSFKKEKKYKKTTVGAKYDTTFSPNDISQTRTIYSKYDVTEKMSIDAAYKNNSLNGLNEFSKGTVSVGPEYKVNKKMSIKNDYSRNMGNRSNKAELGLKYKSFSDDRMDMNAGVGQVQYDDGSASSSQVNFGTNIKF